MINKSILIGNTTAAPEQRFTNNGTPVTTFTVACTDKWKGQDGQLKEDTQFLRCVAWGRQAEIAAEYLGKGSRVYIEGRNEIRKYQAQDGTDRYSHEIKVRELKFLSPRGESSGQSHQQPEPPQGFSDPGTGEDVPF